MAMTPQINFVPSASKSVANIFVDVENSGDDGGVAWTRFSCGSDGYFGGQTHIWFNSYYRETSYEWDVTVIVHELGHALGIDHTPEHDGCPDSVMDGYNGTTPGLPYKFFCGPAGDGPYQPTHADWSEQEPQADDAAGVTVWYPPPGVPNPGGGGLKVCITGCPSAPVSQPVHGLPTPSPLPSLSLEVP